MSSANEPERDFVDERFGPGLDSALDGDDEERMPRRKRWRRVVAAIVALAFSLVLVLLGFARHAHGVHGHLAPFYGPPLEAR